jgi:hypothetical protein
LDPDRRLSQSSPVDAGKGNATSPYWRRDLCRARTSDPART